MTEQQGVMLTFAIVMAVGFALAGVAALVERRWESVGSWLGMFSAALCLLAFFGLLIGLAAGGGDQ